jgi:DNA-binding transcriptional regulator YiaG
MTGEELRQILARIETSQRGFARTIGVSERAVRHWLADENPIPGPVALLAEILANQKIFPK